MKKILIMLSAGLLMSACTQVDQSRNTLVGFFDEERSTQCTLGGIQVHVGEDLDSDDALSIDESTEHEVVCHDTQTTLDFDSYSVQIDINSDTSLCEFGGFDVQWGPHENPNEFSDTLCRGEFYLSDQTDFSGPTIEISFPTTFAVTAEETLTLRGQAEDIQGVLSISINGTPATTENDFAQWEVALPLAVGENPIELIATDAFSNVYSVELPSVTRNLALITDVDEMEYAEDSGLVYFFDDQQLAFYAFNTATNELTLVADNNDDSGITFGDWINGIAYDEAGKKLYVAETDLAAIIEIDLIAQTKRIVSSDSVPDATNSLSAATLVDVIKDPVLPRLLVILLDSSGDGDQVLTVDIETGARTLLSSNTFPNTDNPFYRPTQLMMNDTGTTLWVGEADSDIITVDLATGTRSTDLLSLGGLTFETYEYDSTNHRVLHVDNDGTVLAESLTDFSTTTLSDGTDAALGFALDGKLYSLDTTHQKTYHWLEESHFFVETDFATGIRQTMNPLVPDDNDHYIFQPSEIAIHSENETAFLMDQALSLIYKINLLTGQKSILTSATVPNTDNAISSFDTLALDEANNRLIVANDGTMTFVDIDTGERTTTTVTPATGFSTSREYFNSKFDEINNAIYFCDDDEYAIIKVDLTTMTDSVFAHPDETLNFDQSDDVAIDANRGLVYSLDSGLEAIVAIPMDGSATWVVSDSSTPSSDDWSSSLEYIVYDDSNDRLLVFDRTSVFEVSPTSGQRIKLFDVKTAPGISGITLMDMVFFSEDQLAFVDDYYNALAVYDLETGESVFSAK